MINKHNLMLFACLQIHGGHPHFFVESLFTLVPNDHNFLKSRWLRNKWQTHCTLHVKGHPQEKKRKKERKKAMIEMDKEVIQPKQVVQ